VHIQHKTQEQQDEYPNLGYQTPPAVDERIR
jgi:hypothetical protein